MCDAPEAEGNFKANAFFGKIIILELRLTIASSHATLPIYDSSKQILCQPPCSRIHIILDICVRIS